MLTGRSCEQMWCSVRRNGATKVTGEHRQSQSLMAFLQISRYFGLTARLTLESRARLTYGNTKILQVYNKGQSKKRRYNILQRFTVCHLATQNRSSPPIYHR